MFPSSEAVRYHLEQIRENSLLAMSFLSGLNQNDFAVDLRTRYACERALLNVSEAVRDLERAARRVNPEFKLENLSGGIDWNKAKGIGNVLRHDYDEVRPEIVWTTVVEALPPLAGLCDRLLSPPTNG